MKKNNTILIIIIAVLVVAIAVLAVLNLDNLKRSANLDMEEKFLITTNEKSIEVSMEDVLALKPTKFKGILDTSTTKPTEVQLEGVEVTKLLEKYNVNPKEVNSIECVALDGYATAYTKEEINMAENIYLCITMNGESLKKKSEGGFGTYLIVIKSSTFSQRWCKHLGEIVVK